MGFPVEPRFLVAAEQALGRAFPPGLRSRLLRNNGGEIEAADDSWQLHPVRDDSDRKRLSRTANDIVRENANARTWPGFPPHAVAIAHNGTGDLLVLLPEAEDSSRLGDAVYLWDHETDELIPVLDDLE